jgi:hypothetical protein
MSLGQDGKSTGSSIVHVSLYDSNSKLGLTFSLHKQPLENIGAPPDQIISPMSDKGAGDFEDFLPPKRTKKIIISKRSLTTV